MKISIIAAVAKNGVIGSGQNLPWNLPSDMKRFRRLTINKTVIMGQKTFESIGRPLPKRKNIILTRNRNFRANGCLIAYSIKEALDKAGRVKEVMVAGGASVYRQFLPLADFLYLTLIDHNFKGDVYFPEFDRQAWQEIERIEKRVSEKNPYPHTFLTLKRKTRKKKISFLPLTSVLIFLF